MVSKRYRKSVERPLTKREIRSFFVRCALMCAAIALVYWVGWRSPWARADLRVEVNTPDAVKVFATAPVVPVPVVLQTDPTKPEPSSRAELNKEEVLREKRTHAGTTRREHAEGAEQPTKD